MIVHCRLCKCAIKSIGPPSDNELAQVMDLFARHLVSQHKGQAITLKKDAETLFPLLATHLMISRFIDVPPTETVALKAIEEATEAIMRLFVQEAKPVA